MIVIKKLLKRLQRLLNFTYIEYLHQYLIFSRKSKINDSRSFSIKFSDRYPILYDRTRRTNFDSHYVFHTAWASRILAELRPIFHIDISSLLYFSTLISAYQNVFFFDYRPAIIKISNLESSSADLLQLPFADRSISSLSCMHVVEHVGLGRYGDPIDPNGDLLAMSELSRVLNSSGHLLFVVPVGKPKVCFNAHRIYDPTEIPGIFKNLKLVEFAIVTDRGDFSRKVNPGDYIDQKYACGMYHFMKL